MNCTALLSNVYVFENNPLKKEGLKNHIDITKDLTIYSDYIKDIFTKNEKCHVFEDVVNEQLNDATGVIFEKMEYYLFPFFSKGRKTKYMLIATAHLVFQNSTLDDLNDKLYKFVSHRTENNVFKNKFEEILKKSKHFKASLHFSNCLRNIGKFKLYAFLEAKEKLSEAQRFCILNDFCSGIPNGTTAFSLGINNQCKREDLAYSSDFLNNIKKTNFKTIYRNWSVLSLMDASIILHDPYEKNPNYNKKEIVVQTYYKMYVLNLFYFFFLEEINNYSRQQNHNEKHLFEVFLNYNKYYNLDSLSTKFLPNILNDVFNIGNGLDEKFNSTKNKIMLEKNYAIEKSSGLTSKVLLLIAVLSLSSFLADSTEWIFNLITNNNYIKYKITFNLSIMLTSLISLVIIYLVYKISIKKHK